MMKVKILKVGVSSVSFEEDLEEIKKWLTNPVEKRYIVTPNPEILVAAQKDTEFREILNQADLALPDGIGLIWGSRILGRPLKERITGADFMEKLCQLAAEKGFTVGLMGGRNGVAVKAAECLKKRHPKLKIILAAEEWDGESR